MRFSMLIMLKQGVFMVAGRVVHGSGHLKNEKVWVKM